MMMSTIFDTVLSEDKDVLDLQRNCLSKLELIFGTGVNNLKVNNYYFDGLRGNYEGKLQYCLHFTFVYQNYNFEFYLDYNQLAFYISKNDKTVRKCNLEDFWEPEIMIEKYLNYLMKSMQQLNIN